MLSFFVLTGGSALGQHYSLAGRSALGFSVGLWHESSAANEITQSGIQSTAKAGGFIGSLAFSHWLKEGMAVLVEIGVLSGEASSTVGAAGISQRSSSVVPMLIGIKYYVPEPEVNSPIRPFLSLAAGPYMGFEASSTILVQERRSETAFGVRPSGGIDLLLSRTWKLSVNLGYNLMADFSMPVAARKNYSGSELSFGLGFVFGGGSQ